jgi:PiT family inorganic phosphate transporter
LNSKDPFTNAKRYVPFYIFMTGFIVALVTLFKGLKHIGLDFTPTESYVIATVVGLIATMIGIFMIGKIRQRPEYDKTHYFHSVELVFGVLMIFTACAMAFAHGSNDVANAIGPVAAIVNIVSTDGAWSASNRWCPTGYCYWVQRASWPG